MTVMAGNSDSNGEGLKKNQNFNLVFQEKAGSVGQIRRSNQKICDVKYYFKYWLEAQGEVKEVTFTDYQDNAIKGVVPDIGEIKISFVQGVNLEITFSFKALKNIKIGFYLLALEFPPESFHTRLLPGVYSGYTKNLETYIFNSVYDSAKELYQLALAVDQRRKPLGTTLTMHQYLTMSFPPSYKDGVAELKTGQTVSGRMIVTHSQQDIWDPSHKQRELKQKKNTLDLKPRCNYSEYLKKWEKYIQDKELWIQLGNDMGMFHVGFYDVLQKPKPGGPFGYTYNGKKIRYQELFDLINENETIGKIKLGHFQDNFKQLEIAWGNGCNTMVAYALYLYGGNWFKKKADLIVNTILNFENGGFQIGKGILAGAWICGYDAVNKQFQDHYGGQQIFLPDQGIVNYFLGKIYLDGYNQNPLIIEKIRNNCERFLLKIEERFGTYPNAFSPDGSIGYSREGYLYDKPNAPGITMIILSLLILYKLTKKKKYLDKAEEILKQYLKPLIDRNEFGFLEYDHRGWCSAGSCLILIGLAEYLEVENIQLKNLASELQVKTLYNLLSYRHENDYFVYKHAENVDAWDAVAVNKHGYLHGFTPGSTQGEYMLHIRYEYGYALLRTYQTTKNDAAGKALINHLNYLTWQQFNNPELKKGFGGVTEHTALRTYTQATTHLVHSTPLPIILAEKLNLTGLVDN